MAISKNPLLRQPDNLDNARATQFRFSILKIPNVEYTVTEVNLPGIAFSGDAVLNSRFTSVPFIGDTINYSPVELTFNVQENIHNWREIHDWMTGIGFPENTTQFTAFTAEAAESNASSNRQSLLTSDGTLTILTNKNNPSVRVQFKNMYPTSLSGLQFDTKDTAAETLTATVTMNYDLYSIEVL